MMDYDPDDFAAFRQLHESVTKLPELVTSHREFLEAMKTYAPAGPRKVNVRVLLSIAVSETGAIESVRAIRPTLPPGVHAIAIHKDKSGEVIGRSAADATKDPVFVAAAEAIGRTLRFRPAERNGMPVAFPDYRMSIGFAGGAE